MPCYTSSSMKVRVGPFLSIKNIKHPPLIHFMIDQPLEQPLYSVYESTPRALIPKAISLLFLAFIFYLGVLVNIALLELDASQETSLKSGALIVLGTLIIAGIIITFRKTRQPYLFYRNRIAHGKGILYYVNITNTNPSLNFLDRFFKTYSILLGKKFFIRHIPENIQLSNYLQQLIEYAQKN